MRISGPFLVLIAATLAVAADTEKAQAHYRLASRAFVERRFEAAIEELRKSLAIDARQLGAVRLLGLTYQLTGKLEEAEAQFSEATRLAPKDAESWFYLGRVHYLRNFFDKAIGALNRAAGYAPRDSRIREALAMSLEASGDAVGAQREYEEAMRFLDAKPGAPPTVHANYGAFLMKVNRLDQSERLLRRAVEVAPESWQAHFELGKLYHQTGRFEAALKELQAALGLNPTADEKARTHGLLSAVYSRLGKDEEARRAAAAAER